MIQRVVGVLLDAAEAAYIVNALDEFARMMAERRDARGNPAPSQPTPRLVDTTDKLRRTVNALAVRDPVAEQVRQSEPPAETPDVLAQQHDSVDAGPHVIGTGDAARRLGITPNAARDLARRGRIPARHTGTRWQFDAAAIAARADGRAP